jgi:hypothetical protein
MSNGPAADADALLRRAIGNLQLISFMLDGHLRVAEPHDYGVVDGQARLLFFQIGGESRSGRPLGWRCPAVAKLSRVKLLERHFSGPRAAPSGRHRRWSIIIASVSRPPGPVPAAG